MVDKRALIQRIRPGQLIFLSFVTLILSGTILLMLPYSTTAGRINPVDALFTSTSAVCVTGLVVLDTGKDFTRFGQWVILALIQTGGLGIITFSTFFLQMLGKSISMRSHVSFHEAYAPRISREFRHLAALVLGTTLAIEAVGACVLFFSFRNSFPDSTASYYAIFHSVAAFCNAGFSTFSTNLAGFKSNVVVSLTIATLIVFGGIGFVVLREVAAKIIARLRGERPQLTLHTKLVLIVTAILITAGALAILVLENSRTLREVPWYLRWLPALFQSVTARTAGFNTVPIGSVTNATAFILIILMAIGASPGSTGGGVKTTAAGIYVALLYSRISGRTDVEIFRRTIPHEIVSKAFATVSAYILVAVMVTLLLQMTEVSYAAVSAVRGKFLELMFETFSALGTVGLSMGATPHLSSLGKVILSATMLAGRVGPLALALTVIGRERKGVYHYPEEPVMVG
jgi:trk system potassium uptake protein TrkH